MHPAFFQNANGAGGRKIRPSARRSGFTLLEIMVVVAIMAIVLAMGIPAIRSATHRDAMSQALVDVMDACKGGGSRPGARDQAILLGKVMELRIFPGERRVEVGPAAAAGQPAGTNAVHGFTAQLSDRLTIDMLDVNFLDCKNQDEAVVQFYPNGTCDEFNLILRADDGARRRITLDIATAIPDVSILP